MFVQVILFPLSPSLCLSLSSCLQLRPDLLLHRTTSRQTATTSHQPLQVSARVIHNNDSNVICISFPIPFKVQNKYHLSVCTCSGAGTGSKNSLYPSISIYKSETSGKAQWKVVFTSHWFLHISFIFPALVTASDCNYRKVPEHQSKKCLSRSLASASIQWTQRKLQLRKSSSRLKR